MADRDRCSPAEAEANSFAGKGVCATSLLVCIFFSSSSFLFLSDNRAESEVVEASSSALGIDTDEIAQAFGKSLLEFRRRKELVERAVFKSVTIGYAERTAEWKRRQRIVVPRAVRSFVRDVSAGLSTRRVYHVDRLDVENC